MSAFDEDLDDDRLPDSPFRPGYGRVPPVLAGRDELIRRVLADLTGPSAHHEALYGPRGVGKTALLTGFGDWARRREWLVASHQIGPDEGTGQKVVEKLLDSSGDLPGGWRRRARAHLGALTGFGVAGVTVTRAPSVAGGVDFERALVTAGRLARDADRSVLLLLDEIQALDGGRETVTLTQALQATQTQDLPVHVLVAGLRPPRLDGSQGATFFERIDSATVGFLTLDDARQAIREPLDQAGVDLDLGALDHLARATEGYPYFTQLFGDRAWKVWAGDGATGPLTLVHATIGIRDSTQHVSRLYDGRWSRLGPQARHFLRAMATDTAEGRPAALAAISERLGVPANNLASVRRALIEHHGLIEPAGRGELRFALPLFDRWIAARSVEEAAIDPWSEAPRIAAPGLDAET